MNKCGLHKFNNFCYVCGRYTIMPSRRKISSEIAELYKIYFDNFVVRDVEWAPAMICTGCLSKLNQWYKGEISCMPFGLPMIWTDPQIHNSEECYACIIYVFGTNRNKARNLPYKETRFAQLPLPHSKTIPVPTRPNPAEMHTPSLLETV